MYVVWLSKVNVHLHVHWLTNVLRINHDVGNGQEAESQRLKKSSSTITHQSSPARLPL